MFRVWIVEKKPMEGKNRQYSVREDINVEDTNSKGERWNGKEISVMGRERWS